MPSHPRYDLADLVAQLEAPKFARLSRHMANLPVPGDELRLPAAAYGLRETELLVRKLGQPASLGAWAETWVFQQAFLPVGLWEEAFIVHHLKERLTSAKRDLNAHPSQHSILYGEAQQRGDGQYIPEATEASYYLATNIAVDMSEDAMGEIANHFRACFGELIAEFGFATPHSMAGFDPDAVRRFAIDLLNSPSSYYFVAREGRICVVPMTEHGLYAADAGSVPTAATVTSALSMEVRGLSDLETLVNFPTTSEDDLQAFLTEHPHFLLGLDDSYCEVRPHVALSSPAGTNLVPDFMVRLDDPARFAFIELKKPTARIYGRRQNVGAASQVAAQAIKQLMDYTDAVSTSAARAELRRLLGEAPFDPSLVVVIGRGSHDQRHVWRSLRAGLPTVQVVTYDYLLERARSSRERYMDKF